MLDVTTDMVATATVRLSISNFRTFGLMEMSSRTFRQIPVSNMSMVSLRCAGVLTLLALSPPSAQAQIGPAKQGDLALTLECRGSGLIRFEIQNVGATDTALRLGMVLGNGRKYMVDGLDLIVATPGRQASEYQYSPRDYPAAIGGSLADWIEPLPARAAYSMAAKPEDFFHGALVRLGTFPAEAELSLRWTIRDPRPQAMLLAYWGGTLTSGSCRPAP